MQGFFRALTSLFLPHSCLVCACPLPPSKPGEPLFCPTCFRQLHFIRSPLCPCCGRPFLDSVAGDHLCGSCLSRKPHFDSARALFLYEEPLKTILHDFKYRGKTPLLAGLAGLKQEIADYGLFDRAQLILPVPLHPVRLRERGFNQAQLLAHAFFPGDKRLHSGILIRLRATLPQTGFGGLARRRNLKKAFNLCSKTGVQGKTVLLVDDVFTTGTTVDECAAVLKKAGAQEVLVLTLARVKEDW